ncbi:MAG TPA: phosphate ABC transporter permease subunit PstC [Patescibacteria group bacterium]|nr:phosphate ABC transporter permease subunit PstC [Patescibacteria group bacterium]
MAVAFKTRIRRQSNRISRPEPTGAMPPVPPAGRVRVTGRRDARWRKLSDWLIEKFFLLNGVVAIVIIGLIFVFLFREAGHALASIPVSSWWGRAETDFDGNEVYVHMWQPNGDRPKYSLIPLLLGSFLVAVPALLIAGSIGLASGVYLAEIASRRTRDLVKPIIELLAGIPTVVIGFFCLATLATLMQSVTRSAFRLNAIVGAIGVSFVVIPVIASMVDDALRAVPGYLREAAYGMGSTRWETTSRVVFPAALSGITAALILGMGRALGETMIVLMATGNAAQVTLNPFVSVRTMTATIAAELGSVPKGGDWYASLFLVGAVLFTITFALNLIAEMVINRMRRKLTL